MQMLRTPGMELLKIHMLHFTSFVPSTKVHCQCRSIHCLGRCRWSCRDSMYVGYPWLQCTSWISSFPFVSFNILLIMIHDHCHAYALSSPFGSASKWFRISIHKKKIHPNSVVHVYVKLARQILLRSNGFWRNDGSCHRTGCFTISFYHLGDTDGQLGRRGILKGLSMFTMGKHFDSAT